MGMTDNRGFGMIGNERRCIIGNRIRRPDLRNKCLYNFALFRRLYLRYIERRAIKENTKKHDNEFTQ
jgi:hypothetical protein